MEVVCALLYFFSLFKVLTWIFKSQMLFITSASNSVKALFRPSIVVACSSISNDLIVKRNMLEEHCEMGCLCC